MIKTFKNFLNVFDSFEKKEFSKIGKKRLWEIYKEEYQHDDDDNDGIGLENYSEYKNKEELIHDYTPSELRELEDCDEIETLTDGSILIIKI